MFYSELSVQENLKVSELIIECNEYLRGKYDPENIWLYENIAQKYADIDDIDKATEFF